MGNPDSGRGVIDDAIEAIGTPSTAAIAETRRFMKKFAFDTVARSQAILYALESQEHRRRVRAAELMELAAKLGELMNEASWSGIDASDASEIASFAKNGRERLKRVVGADGEHLSRLFSVALRSEIAALSKARRSAARQLRRGKLGVLLTWEEFLDELIFPLDRATYALEVGRLVGLEPRVAEAKKTADLMAELREFIPRAFAVFEKAGDLLPGDPSAYPDSFWWHHWKPAV